MDRFPVCYRVYVLGVYGGDVFVRVKNLEEASVYRTFALKNWPENTGVEIRKEVCLPLDEAEAQELRDRG